jgi:hypothetical protein
MLKKMMRAVRQSCGCRNDSVGCELEGRKVSGTSPSETIFSTEVLTEESTMKEAMASASMPPTEVLAQKKMMNEAIVSAVGKVWKHLNDNGAASFSELGRKTGLSNQMANRAIGWLAREDKLCFETANGPEQIRLR